MQLPITPIPLTGPQALHHALSKLDIPSLEAEARKDLNSGVKTKRPKAINMLNVIKGLNTSGNTPTDYMIKKVPVLPPLFRPFSIMGDTFMPGDANELLKDLMNYKELHGELANEVGEENTPESAHNVYKAVKALYGYDDPINPKTKQRGVSGFLQHLLGKSGPKTSWFQRRLFSKNQDSVGRSVITANPELNMDQIGIPEEMAWKLYGPYVQRRLVKAGIPALRALDHITDRSDMADKALNLEMGERPVIYSRSPCWFKYSVIAGHPHRVKGDNIESNLYSLNAQGGDFDGNCIIGSSKILLKYTPVKKKVKEISENVTTGIGGDLYNIIIDKFFLSSHSSPVLRDIKNMKTIINNEEIVKEIEIKDMPYIASTKKIDKNGASVYEVPKGLSVWTTDVDGKGSRWSPVTAFTVEVGCNLKKVTTRNKRTVTCSENESIAIYGTDGKLNRVKPEDAIGQVVPVIAQLPVLTKASVDNQEYGWFIGALVSDGWITLNKDTGIYYMGYSKFNKKHRERFEAFLASLFPADKYTVREYMNSGQGFSDNRCKIHISSTDKNNEVQKWFEYLADVIYVGSKEDKAKHIVAGFKSAIIKRIPEEMFNYSRATLLGLAAGLQDGDGSSSINRNKKRPGIVVNFSTSSPTLRDNVIVLGKLLGIRMSYGTTKPSAGRPQVHDAYNIVWSVVDVARLINEIPCEETEALKHLKEVGVNKDDRNVVPVSLTILERFRDLTKDPSSGIKMSNLASKFTDARKANGMTTVSREAGRTLVKAYTGERDALWTSFVNVVNDNTTHWDVIVSVEDAPTETVYDLEVPETKVFALSSGLVVYDTFNISVPSQQDAVKEAYENLLPSSMAMSTKKPDTIMHSCRQEQILGLYTSKHRPALNKHVFKTEAEAMEAIRSGKVRLSDEVEIGEHAPQPQEQIPTQV